MEAYIVSYGKGQIDNIDKHQFCTIFSKWVKEHHYAVDSNMLNMTYEDIVNKNSGLFKIVSDLRQQPMYVIDRIYPGATLYINKLTHTEMANYVVQSTSPFSIAKGDVTRPVRYIQVSHLTKAKMEEAMLHSTKIIAEELKKKYPKLKRNISYTCFPGKFAVIYIYHTVGEKYLTYNEVIQLQNTVFEIADNYNIGIGKMVIENGRFVFQVLKDIAIQEGATTQAIPNSILKMEEKNNTLIIEVSRPIKSVKSDKIGGKNCICITYEKE